MVVVTSPKLVSNFLPLARRSIKSLYGRMFSDSVQNSAPINGTYIIRSVAAAGREFCVLLYVELLQPPKTLK